MSHPTLIEVAVPTPLRKNFRYLCPVDFSLPVIGARVTVPFAGRELVGLVTAHLDCERKTKETSKERTAITFSHRKEVSVPYLL